MCNSTFPYISNIIVNAEVKGGNNHPISSTSLSSLGDTYIEGEDYENHNGMDKNASGVIINIEGHEIENEIVSSREIDLNEDPITILTKIRNKNSNRPIIGHININYLYNKFQALKSLFKDKLDVLVVTETKINESYPTGQFRIEGFVFPFRLDRDNHGGGVIIYVNEGIPCKEIPFHNRPSDMEGIIVELNLKSKKWLLLGAYNHVSNALDRTLSKYDNFLLLGDFNSTVSEEAMKNFCEMYDLKNLIKTPTCYKTPDNPTSIDVMLTKKIVLKILLQSRQDYPTIIGLLP